MNPEYRTAMQAPIACRGFSCRQGREACTTPMRCSGSTFIADAAVARIKSSIPRYPEQDDMPVTMEDKPSMLASRGFWGGLCVSLVVWSGLWYWLTR